MEPVKRFTSARAALNKIWHRIQGLPQPGKPKTQGKAAVAKRGAKIASARPQAGKKDDRSKGTSKTRKSSPREGSKAGKVISMLQRKNGATLSEIMDTMGWQKHTVRGFVAGSMKETGYKIESFKPDSGERTYRIPQ